MAESDETDCPECQDTGQRTCDVCRGQGFDVCQDCDGWGSEGGEVCWSCDDGYEACGGSGWLECGYCMRVPIDG